MNFNDIATVSGKGGLFKIVAPTRGGMILESMDAQKKKLVVNINSKVSVLGEISVYTTDKEGAKPLDEVMKKIHEEFNGDTGLTSSSEADELRSFISHILPNYDEDQVYVSDIKKIVTWYAILSKDYQDIFSSENTEESKKEKSE